MYDPNKIKLELKDKPKLILVGNANTGKSLIFNYLTKQYVTVSNYPGTTVDITKGIGKFPGDDFIVIDTPGTNSLLPQSEDEAVTRRLILSEEPKAIIQVIDSKGLKRSLSLTQELADLGIPLILSLNMSDEAMERGIKIDVKALSESLGVKVVETIAITRDGLAHLRNSVVDVKAQPVKTSYTQRIEEAIEDISSLLPKSVRYKRFTSVAIISGDKEILSLIDLDSKLIRQIEDKVRTLQKEYPRPLKLVIQASREKRSKVLSDRVVTLQGFVLKRRWQEYLSRFALDPITAIPMAIFLIYVMYKFVGEFAAGTVVGFLEDTVFGEYLIPWISSVLALIKSPPWINDFLLGEYGVVSMAVTYSLAIIFPIVQHFLFFLAS